MKRVSCPFLEITLMRLVYPLQRIRLEAPRVEQRSVCPKKCCVLPLSKIAAFAQFRMNGANGKREESDGSKPEDNTYKSC